MSPLVDEALSAEDQRTLHDPRLARTALLAGVLAVLLAPIVVGFLAGAVGLHAGVSHLRTRLGHRGLAWAGVAASTLGSMLALGAALLWGATLLGILLSRSAIEQARTWEGTAAPRFALTTDQGQFDSAGDGIVLLDVFDPSSPFCEIATRELAKYADRHATVRAVSWAPERTIEEAAAFAARIGATQPIAAGPQAMPEPFSIVSAKPTLFVIDGEGRIRAVLLGTYDGHSLDRLIEVARQPFDAAK
jgi:hypothetical protein